MTEAQFQTQFNTWLKESWVGGSAAFELKLCKEGRIPLTVLRDHQFAALRMAKHGKLVWKIGDYGYDQKPFDCFLLSKAEAYVVILFYVPRKQKRAFLLPVDMWQLAKEKGKKSLTEDEVHALSTVVAYL